MSYTVDQVVIDDHKMKYIKFGCGVKTLVILPGLSVQSVIPAAGAIEKQYEIFSRDFTVYLFDRRSDLPDKYSVFDMAEDTAGAMNILGLKNVCLFGASQGGMIAEVIAAEYPELVGKLALGSSACRTDQERFSIIAEWIRLAKEGKAKELYLSFGEKVYPPKVFEKYREILIKTSKSVTEKDLKRFIILAEGSAGFDVKNKLKLIRCPVLAIGDHTDAVLGAEATLEIADALKNKPDFEMYMYSSYGHAAYDTAPGYTQRLFDFFTEEPIVELRAITEENFIEAFNLTLAPGQEKYVSHPIRSLAQAYVYRDQCQPFGIYADGKMVGYVMVIYDYDVPEYDIWHMMIDKTEQGRGYGGEALDRVIEYIKTKPFGDSDRVALTCNKENPVARKLYENKGFSATGIEDVDELELVLTLGERS